MAHVLDITDGTNTANLSTGGCYLLRFVPVPVNEVTLIGASSIEVMFHGSYPANTSSYKQAIERLLEAARRRASWGNGARVYLNFQQEASGVTQRAEVFDGSIEMVADSVHENAQNYMGAVVKVSHGPWEGPRTEISITNSNGSGTGGLSIYNHDDGGAGHDNYATVLSSYVDGAMSAPVEIQIQNLSTSKQINSIHVANDIQPSGTVSAMLEGENGTATGGSSTVGSYSNGNVLSFTVNTTNTITWTLTAATLQYLNGRNIRLLGKFEFSGTVYAKWWLELGGVKVTPVAPEVALSNQNYFQDLGPLPLPPGGIIASDFAAMSLVISFRSIASVSMKCDFVQLTPSDDGVYRKLLMIQANYTASVGAVFVSNGTDDYHYIQSGGNKYPLVATRGNPLLVYPKRDQKLRFLLDGSGFSVDWNLQVQLFYRPRWCLPV